MSSVGPSGEKNPISSGSASWLSSTFTSFQDKVSSLWKARQEGAGPRPEEAGPLEGHSLIPEKERLGVIKRIWRVFSSVISLWRTKEFFILQEVRGRRLEPTGEMAQQIRQIVNDLARGMVLKIQGDSPSNLDFNEALIGLQGKAPKEVIGELQSLKEEGRDEKVLLSVVRMIELVNNQGALEKMLSYLHQGAMSSLQTDLGEKSLQASQMSMPHITIEGNTLTWKRDNVSILDMDKMNDLSISDIDERQKKATVGTFSFQEEIDVEKGTYSRTCVKER